VSRLCDVGDKRSNLSSKPLFSVSEREGFAVFGLSGNKLEDRRACQNPTGLKKMKKKKASILRIATKSKPTNNQAL
jgi:hypothetical protein